MEVSHQSLFTVMFVCITCFSLISDLLTLCLSLHPYFMGADFQIEEQKRMLDKIQLENTWIGVCLQEPVFSHGQLYVAVSRVGHPENIRLAIPRHPLGETCEFVTRNIVYQEVL